MTFIKYLIITSLILFQTIPSMAQNKGATWEKISMGIFEKNFNSLAISPTSSNILFLDAKHRIYRSLDRGQHWQQIFSIPENSESQLNEIFSSPHDPNVLFITSTQGLFRSSNLGETFELIFSSAQKDINNCHGLAFHPTNSSIYYLGTEAGLYWTTNNGETWVYEMFSTGSSPIKKILYSSKNKASLFLLTDKTLISYNPISGDTHILFEISSLHTSEETELTPDNFEELPLSYQLKDFSFTSESSLLLATETALLKSNDLGETWELYPSTGLKSHQINNLLGLDEHQIFISTDNGVYQFLPKDQRWQELIEGLDENQITDLQIKENILFSLTSSGLFQRPNNFPNITMANFGETYSLQLLTNQIQRYFEQEPSIQEIHQAAVQYADVSDKKIRRWQQQSRLKHLLPTLSGGFKENGAKTVDLDRSGTTTPDVFILGPEEKNWGWDVDVSWDLTDLIWSSSQTSIDSRSRLTVDLRNEILTNLTRIYFERKRVITEHFINSNNSNHTSYKIKNRIEELTALLDVYTGGYFSEEMEERGIEELKLGVRSYISGEK